MVVGCLRGRGREREIVKKEYLNKVAKKKKKKVWNVGCVVKWYSIIDKSNF